MGLTEKWEIKVEAKGWIATSECMIGPFTEMGANEGLTGMKRGNGGYFSLY